MPTIKITAADLAKTANIEAKWYGATIKKVDDPAPSKEGSTINVKIHFLIEHAVTNGGAPVPGKEIIVTFNSTLWGKIAPLYESATGKKMGEGEFDLAASLEGKKVDVKVGTRNYNGQLFDDITQFVPYGKSKEAMAF